MKMMEWMIEKAEEYETHQRQLAKIKVQVSSGVQASVSTKIDSSPKVQFEHEVVFEDAWKLPRQEVLPESEPSTMMEEGLVDVLKDVWLFEVQVSQIEEQVPQVKVQVFQAEVQDS